VVEDAAFAPDGRLLAAGPSVQSARQGDDPTVELKVWERVQ